MLVDLQLTYAPIKPFGSSLIIEALDQASRLQLARLSNPISKSILLPNLETPRFTRHHGTALVDGTELIRVALDGTHRLGDNSHVR